MNIHKLAEQKEAHLHLVSNNLWELNCGHKDSAAAPEDLYEAPTPWVVGLDMIWTEEGAVERQTLGAEAIRSMPFLEVCIQESLHSVPSQSVPSLNCIELHKQKQKQNTWISNLAEN